MSSNSCQSIKKHPSPLSVHHPLKKESEYRWLVTCAAGAHWRIYSSLLYSVLISLVWVQFSSIQPLCPTLWDSKNRSMPGLPVHHQLLESTQTHVHWVSDAIQPSYPLSSPSPPALNLSQNQGVFQWVSFSHQVTKLLEFQLQHQSFQWTPRTDLL